MLAATCFYPEDQSISNVIVIASALGVPRYIYSKLAQFFADYGFAVITFDYRGIHESQSKTISGSKMQMEDWGKQDINAALKYAIDRWQPKELIYVAHSCGGQLLGLAKHATQIDKGIFIACQSGYWKLWPVPQRWGLWLIWHLIPKITPWFDDFPARTLRLSSVNIPSGVASQWAAWGKSSNYLWDFIDSKDYQRYQNLSFPLFSIGFTDDQYFGPPESVKKLLDYYPATESKISIVSPADYNQKSIGHFGFLKSEFRNTLWKELINWIKGNNLIDKSV